MNPFFYLSLSILIKVCEGATIVVGIAGHNVTLPCTYDAQAHGVLAVCWGQGEVPTSKCSNTVLSSWGGTVDYRRSGRYQFLGSMREGDVSLTLLHAGVSDSGVYGCRVQIPGWFNDLKFNTHLIIVEAPVEDPITQTYIPPIGGRQDMLTTSIFEPSGTDEPVMEPVVFPAEERFKAFLETGNIVRMAAILLTTIIVILTLIFRKRCLVGRIPGCAETESDKNENIYEIAP